MKNLYLMLIFVFSLQSSACLSMLEDGNDKKDHPAIKHFYEKGDKQRLLILENVSDVNCEFSITKTELIQKSNGSYSYFKTTPDVKLERSLNSYMGLLSESGENAFTQKQVLAPGQKGFYFFTFNFPNEKKNGTYYSGIQIDLKDNYNTFLISEVYFTFLESSPKPKILYMSFDNDSKKLRYFIKNSGNAYTFYKNELVFIDPLTGFRTSSYIINGDERKNFQTYIRNYLLPHGKVIKTDYSISKYLKKVKEQFTKEFPNTELPKMLSLTIIPKFGIDFQTWENHYNIPLKYKSLTISTGF